MSDQTSSRIAIAKHPVHPMLVVYPVAFLTTVPLIDAVFWWLGDPFWAQVSLLLAAAGFIGGLIAAVTGFAEFALVRRVRQRPAGWSHMLTAVMALALAGASARWRLDDPAGAAFPWGFVLSSLTALMVVIAGWLGGTLTFAHGIGTYAHPHDAPGEGEDSG